MTDDEFDDDATPLRKNTPTADEVCAAVAERYDEWDRHQEGARRLGWQFLSYVYTIAPELQSGSLLEVEVRKKVEEHPDFCNRKRPWRPKTQYEVLLTYRLGLNRSMASKKSNLLKTLKQAEAENVPHSEEAFMAWIESVGGAEKARRPEKREPVNVEELAESIPTPPDPDNAFQVRLPAEEVLPGGFAVVFAKLFKRDGEHCLLEPIEVFTDARTVEGAAAKLKRKWDSAKRAEVRNIQREQARELKRQQQIDEHGDRPPKHTRPKRRKHPMPPLGFRKRKPKGDTLRPFTDGK